MRTFAEDARPWLERSGGGYDAIMVDAYRQPYIPFYLTTREFFELTRERLAPGGIAIVNVGHPEGSDELERVLGRTMAAAFPRVLRYPIEPTNTLLVGGERRLLGRAPAPQRRGPAGARCDRWPATPPRRWRRACRAARSSPTTAPRSSGWSTAPCWNTRMNSPLERLRAWLVTGPVGRGLSFAIDFAVAFRSFLAERRAQPSLTTPGWARGRLRHPSTSII